MSEYNSKRYAEGANAQKRSLEEQARLMDEFEKQETQRYEDGADDAAFNEAMARREHEANAVIEGRIMENPLTRRMYFIAQQIDELKGNGGAKETIKHKEDKLLELIDEYVDGAHLIRETQLENADEGDPTPESRIARIGKQVVAEEQLEERMEEVDFILNATGDMPATTTVNDTSAESTAAHADKSTSDSESVSQPDSTEQASSDAAQEDEEKDYPIKDFPLNKQVIVKRSDGTVENDWFVKGYAIKDNSQAIIVNKQDKNGDLLSRTFSADELRDMQLLEVPAQPAVGDQEPERRFTAPGNDIVETRQLDLGPNGTKQFEATPDYDDGDYDERYIANDREGRLEDFKLTVANSVKRFYGRLKNRAKTARSQDVKSLPGKTWEKVKDSSWNSRIAVLGSAGIVGFTIIYALTKDTETARNLSDLGNGLDLNVPGNDNGISIEPSVAEHAARDPQGHLGGIPEAVQAAEGLTNPNLVDVTHGQGLIDLAANYGISEQQFYDLNLGERALNAAPEFVQQYGNDEWIKSAGQNIVPESIQRLFALSSLSVNK